MTQIHKTKAAPSLNIRAEVIREGRKKTRVQLGSTTSTSLAIAAYTINNPFDRVFAYFAVKSKRYVKTEIEGQTLILDVNSTYKRLHLTKRQVRATGQKNYVSKLIQQAEKTEQTLKNYRLLNQEHGNKTPLNPSTLMELVHDVLETEVGAGVNLTLTAKKKLVVVHQKKNEVKLRFTEKLIASGGIAHIYALSPLQGKAQVYKTPRLEVHQEEGDLKTTNRSFQKEVSINKKLNQKGPQDGIMLAIHLAEPFGVYSQETGIIMPHYDQDYFTLCEENKLTAVLFKKQQLQIVREFEKLLHGLAYIHSLDIVHADIKPDNILLRSKDNRVDIIDFGGATEKDKGEMPFASFATTNYIYSDDLTALNALSEHDIENRYLVGEAMDVFALGSVFYARLIFKTPYPIPEKQEYQSGQNCTSLPAFVPSELKTLLARMTHTDCNKRITAVEGYNFINQYRIKLESK